MTPNPQLVCDVMKQNVARLDADTPVKEAMELLESDRISGAPIVDPSGQVIGVFSMTDVARAQAQGEFSLHSTTSGYYMPEPGLDEEADDFSAKDSYSPATLVTGTVAEWMSADVVAVAPDVSIQEACRRMADHGIHRVLVLEKSQ
ncbi:MAG: CBS domain-containing protein [Planctomycetota bacterium]